MPCLPSLPSLSRIGDDQYASEAIKIMMNGLGYVAISTYTVKGES